VNTYDLRTSPPSGGLAHAITMVFEYILCSSPRRRASHSVAEGLWSLNTYSALARAGGLRIP